MSEFLRAAFSQGLKWDTAVNAFAAQTEVRIMAAEALCWHDKCGVFTDIVTRVVIANPGMELEFTLADVGTFPALADQIVAQLPDTFDASHIKQRYSRTQERSYLSNGCVGCDRIFGDFHLHEHRDVEAEIARVPIQLSGAWLRLAQSDPEIEEGSAQWWVVPAQQD
jgi:competence protein CoiA